MLDSIEYYICAGDRAEDVNYSCFHAASQGQDLKAFRARQLAWIIGSNHRVLTREVLQQVASFLGSAFHEKKWVRFDARRGFLSTIAAT